MFGLVQVILTVSYSQSARERQVIRNVFKTKDDSRLTGLVSTIIVNVK